MKEQTVKISDFIDKNNNNISWIACGIIITLFAVFGVFYQFAPKDLTWFHFLKEHIAVSILLTAATFIIVCLLLRFLFSLLDRISAGKTDAAETGAVRVPLKRWAAFTGVILLLWLPYIIAVSPGTVAGLDYCWQLAQGCGVLPLSGHHPVLGSIVFGSLYRIGFAFGGADCGILFTMIFQCVLMAAVLGYCVSALSCLGLPRTAAVILTAVFGIDPVISLHAIWAVKDSIFSSIAVLFFFGIFLRIYSVRHHIAVPKPGSMPALILLAVLISLYRNGTAVIAAAALISVVLYELHKVRGKRTNKVYINAFLPLLIFCVCISGWSLVLKEADVYPSDMRESVGMPVRQIMKSLEKEPDTFSERDMAILERVYKERIEQGKTLRGMAESDDYDSLVNDYIKPPSLKNKQDMKDYFRVWADVGMKNPVIYSDEALRWSNAYWWPGYDPEMVYYPAPVISVKMFSDSYDMKNKQLKDYFYPLAMSLEEHPDLLNRTIEEAMSGSRCLEHFLDVDFYFPDAANKLIAVTAKAEKVPVLSLLFVPAFYSWILLIGLAWCFSRRKQYEIGLWPVLLCIIMACLSPANGYMRYALPVVLFSFIMLGICMLPGKSYDRNITK